MTTKKAQKAAEVLANKRAAWLKKVAALTGHVFKRISGKVEAFDAGMTADDFAASVAAREPVGAAIHPLKTRAVEYAADEARKIVERVRADLAKHGNDINAAAPYPNSMRDSRSDYITKHAKYSLYHSLTTTDPEIRRAPHWNRDRNEARHVIMYDDGIARFINNAERDAALQYDMFICKMVAKIGECDSAELHGNHVWSYSVLTVLKGDKTEQWKTQQIVNYSKFGLPYLQWPSRLMK